MIVIVPRDHIARDLVLAKDLADPGHEANPFECTVYLTRNHCTRKSAFQSMLLGGFTCRDDSQTFRLDERHLLDESRRW